MYKISLRLNKVSILYILMVYAIFLCFMNCYAISFGRMQIQSNYGEPLKANIAIHDYALKLSPSDITVKNISMDSDSLAYSYAPYRDIDGKLNIAVSSNTPVNTHFLSFPLKITHPEGVDQREFMVFVRKKTDEDLKSIKINKDSQPKLSNNSSSLKTDEVLDEINTKNNIETKTKENQTKIIKTKIQIFDLRNTKTKSTSDSKTKENNIKQDIKSNTGKSSKSVNSNNFNNYRYFTTKPGITLWRIAFNHVNNKNNIDKMVKAIYENNKAAFINGDIKHLQVGVRLKIPQEQDLGKKYQVIYETAKSSNHNTNKNKESNIVGVDSSTNNQTKESVSEGIRKTAGVVKTIKNNLLNELKRIKSTETSNFKVKQKKINNDSNSLKLNTKIDVANSFSLTEDLVTRIKLKQKIIEELLLLKSNLERLGQNHHYNTGVYLNELIPQGNLIIANKWLDSSTICLSNSSFCVSNDEHKFSDVDVNAIKDNKYECMINEEFLLSKNKLIDSNIVVSKVADIKESQKESRKGSLINNNIVLDSDLNKNINENTCLVGFKNYCHVNEYKLISKKVKNTDEKLYI